MSPGGITNFWRESKQKWKFPLDLLFLLEIHTLPWWLVAIPRWRIAWPPRGLKLPTRGFFTLVEVQAMSLGGILIFGGKIQKIMEFSTRIFMSACLHILPWWLVAIPRQGQWVTTPRFKSTSPRFFYPWGGTGNVLGRNNNFWQENTTRV